jgi:hypothetical protein
MTTYEVGADGAGDASLASAAKEKVQGTATQATDAAAKMIREQTESRGKQAAEELQNVTEALRRSSHALRADGKNTSAQGIETVTDKIESLARYVGGTGGDQMLRDLEAFGRRKPWGMIGVGVGLGVAAARVLKASSSRRFDASGGYSGGDSRPRQFQIEPVTGEMPVVQTRSI